MTTISNCDDTIDTRDLIRHVDDLYDTLCSMHDDYIQALYEAGDYPDGHDEDEVKEELTKYHPLDTFIEECEDCEADEYKSAKAFLEDVESNTSEAHSGETLIHEDHFEEYAEQLADDIGAIDPKAGWPLNHIDWESAARELSHDYSEVDWDGQTYLVRSS